MGVFVLRPAGPLSLGTHVDEKPKEKLTTHSYPSCISGRHVRGVVIVAVIDGASDVRTPCPCDVVAVDDQVGIEFGTASGELRRQCAHT